MTKLFSILISFFIATQIVLAQGNVIYLPLVLKDGDECMANWARLEISDGTITVNLISVRTGFHLSNWDPQIIQPKDGGVFQDSPIAPGRRLVFAVDATAMQGFDLATEIPLRATLFRRAEDEHVLVAVVHHIAADGWSISPLIRDLGQAYSSRCAGRAPGWACRRRTA